MAGNNYNMKPQFSRQDAGFGNVLIGDGKFGFKWMNYLESGFFVQGEVRHLKAFKDKSGRKYMIAALNGEQPKIFDYNK